MPASLFIFALGLAMAAMAVSWVRFQLGAAPLVEPIYDLVSHLPLLEAIFMGTLYGLVALGALNFYIHIGMLESTTNGTHYKY